MVCFDKAESIPSNKPMFLLERFHVILDALAAYDSWNGKRTRDDTEILVGWESPPDGWVVLNTDGEARDNPGPAGGDGVLQGCRGEWICGFTEGMGILRQ